nr:hypothetical protein [Bacillus pumilus]
MNLESSEKDQKMLGSMFQSQCLFKDIYGRMLKRCIYKYHEGYK